MRLNATTTRETPLERWRISRDFLAMDARRMWRTRHDSAWYRTECRKSLNALRHARMWCAKLEYEDDHRNDEYMTPSWHGEA